MRRSQNFARTHTGRKRGKIFPDKSIYIKGSTSGLVMNSYLNGNLEDKQCYFSLDYFSTITKFKLRLKVGFYILAREDKGDRESIPHAHPIP